MAETNTEKEMILAVMHKLAEGKFEGLDSEAFEDKAFVAEFNDCVMQMGHHNNNYLMRINESMGQIGNIGWIKNIFSIINKQDVLLNNFHAHKDIFDTSIDMSDEYNVRVIALMRQIENNLKPCIENLKEAIKEVEAAKEAGSLSEGSEKKISRLMDFAKNNIYSMLDASEETLKYVKHIYDNDVERVNIMRPLLQDINDLAASCNALSVECFNAGLTMYNISRSVDNVRNDMYRHNSILGVHDCLKIYAIDHLVLTWRIFNHIQEYEVLVINQLNNPDRCKFGLWCRNQAPEWLRETVGFKAAFAAHEEIHKHAVAAFEAKKNVENELAMEEFEYTLSALNQFLAALDVVHNELRMRGDTEETELLVGV